MGTSKTDTYSTKQMELSKFAKALAHPARIAILQVIINRRTCICGSIVEELPLSQSTVSQHLKELKEAGLIRGNIDGKSVCYCIDQENWKKAKQSLVGFFDSFVEQPDCC